MAKQFSSAYVSGDLGQAIAIRDGIAMIFDGKRMQRATTGEINLFFDMSMDFHQLPDDMVRFLDVSGISNYVRRERVAADVVRFLLFGMDGELSEPLRLSSIQEANRLLAGPDVRQHVQRRFLNAVALDDWDLKPALIFAALVDADVAGLLYLALGNAGQVEEIRSAEPDSWPVAEARRRLVRHVAGGRRESMRSPVWALAADWLDGPAFGSEPGLQAEWFVNRFRSAEIPAVAALVTHAMIVSVAARYMRQGDVNQAIAAFDDIADQARCLARDWSCLFTAIVLICKASLLSDRGDHPAAHELHVRAIQLLADRTDQWALEWQVEARFLAAGELVKRGLRRSAIEEYNTIAEVFGRHQSPRIRALVAKAMYNRANALVADNELRSACSAYITLQEALQNDGRDEIRRLLAKVHYNLGCACDALGEHDEAVLALSAAVGACSGRSDADSRHLVQNALYNLGTIFGKTGRGELARSRYREVIAAVGQPENADREHLAVQAMFNLALSLEQTSAFSEALEIYVNISSTYRRNAAYVRILAKVSRRVLRIRALLASSGRTTSVQEVDARVLNLARMFGLTEED